MSPYRAFCFLEHANKKWASASASAINLQLAGHGSRAGSGSGSRRPDAVCVMVRFACLLPVRDQRPAPSSARCSTSNCMTPTFVRGSIHLINGCGVDLRQILLRRNYWFPKMIWSHGRMRIAGALALLVRFTGSARTRSVMPECTISAWRGDARRYSQEFWEQKKSFSDYLHDLNPRSRNSSLMASPPPHPPPQGPPTPRREFITIADS